MTIHDCQPQPGCRRVSGPPALTDISKGLRECYNHSHLPVPTRKQEITATVCTQKSQQDNGTVQQPLAPAHPRDVAEECHA